MDVPVDVAVDGGPAGVAGTEVDAFATTLDAFIAVGLTGRDLVVNGTATAWLVTVRQVDRICGRAAARQALALALFITIALTICSTAWLLSDGEQPAVAIYTVAGLPLGVLLAVWGKLGGE